MLNDYHFVTHWRFQGSAEEVYDLLSNPVEYPRWWPAVYLSTEQTGAGDERGVGCTVRLHTKGWLPYTLHWESCAIRAEPPNVLAIRAAGDFDGRGIWIIEPHGEYVDVTFDWCLRGGKPLLSYLSPLLKPAFAANHRWAMEQGRKSLELELLRRRARNRKEEELIPRPPGPNVTSGYVLVAAAIGLTALAAALLRSRSDADAG